MIRLNDAVSAISVVTLQMHKCKAGLSLHGVILSLEISIMHVAARVTESVFNKK